MVLHEVPGALERPAHCAIRIERTSKATVVEIPPLRLGKHVALYAIIFTTALLTFFVTGAVLYATGKPILLLDMIAGNGALHGLSPPLRRYIGWTFPLWVGFLWIGGMALASVIRPAYHWECLKFDAHGVEIERKTFGKLTIRHIAGDSVRVFTLRNDDNEGVPVTLVLEGRGESFTVGEYLRPIEREWLASVGNAILRTSPG